MPANKENFLSEPYEVIERPQPRNPTPPALPSPRDSWATAYRNARVSNRRIERQTARVCCSVDDACRKVGRLRHNDRGHGAACLRVAGELRQRGELQAARQILERSIAARRGVFA